MKRKIPPAGPTKVGEVVLKEGRAGERERHGSRAQTGVGVDHGGAAVRRRRRGTRGYPPQGRGPLQVVRGEFSKLQNDQKRNFKEGAQLTRPRRFSCIQLILTFVELD